MNAGIFLLAIFVGGGLEFLVYKAICYLYEKTRKKKSPNNLTPKEGERNDKGK